MNSKILFRIKAGSPGQLQDGPRRDQGKMRRLRPQHAERGERLPVKPIASGQGLNQSYAYVMKPP
jgi:hypothetical protein